MGHRFKTLEVRIGTWKQLLQVADRLESSGKDWVFRGHADASYPLESTLDRTRKRFGVKGESIWNLEEWYLDEFKRCYSIYSPGSTPEDEDTIYWLSLMRHYGAPSRFVDFTFSFFIAAYFALEDSKAWSAIWAISKTWLNGPCVKLRERISKNALEKAWADREGWAFDMLMLRDKHDKKRKHDSKMIFPTNPLQLHQRLAAQQGLFLCPTDISATFEENLSAIDGSSSRNNVVKIVLKGSCRARKSLLYSLYRAGISRAVLFPDLDGFARGLGSKTPVFLKMREQLTTGARIPSTRGLE
jgi:hypothetical protein